MASVHRHAASFGGVAEAYERGRPSFPPPLVDHVVDVLDLRPGRRALDLAAGTGKLTRLLVDTGADVVAVEPSAGMREVFTRKLPGVAVLDGTAEAVPLEDGSVDAVTVAQAWHWFEPAAAFAELDRVLRPDGRAALVWNVRDPDDPLEAAATEVLAPYREDTPDWEGLDLPAQVAGSPFTRTEQFVHWWSMSVDESAFLDRFLSVSFVASLGPADRRLVTDHLLEVFRAHEVDGRVDHAYRAESHLLERA